MHCCRTNQIDSLKTRSTKNNRRIKKKTKKKNSWATKFLTNYVYNNRYVASWTWSYDCISSKYIHTKLKLNVDIEKKLSSASSSKTSGCLGPLSQQWLAHDTTTTAWAQKTQNCSWLNSMNVPPSFPYFQKKAMNWLSIYQIIKTNKQQNERRCGGCMD